MIVGRADDAVFLVEHRVDFPTAQDMVAGGDDIGAGTEQHLGAVRCDAIALCGVFPVDDAGINLIGRFEGRKMACSKFTAGAPHNIP